MSHDIDGLISAELRQLRLLVERRRPSIARSLAHPPELEALDALSALLHSFYAGIERTLVHIAKREGVYRHVQSRALTWHAALLSTLTEAADTRPAVISEVLCNHLKAYLGFRHVFRHAYLHELQWSKMRILVENIDQVLAMFEKEIRAYLDGDM